MGFWDSFDKAGVKLKDVGELLEVANDTYNTAQHGYSRVKSSKMNFEEVVARNVSGEDMRLAIKYDRKKDACKRNTIIFCILLIIATILICMYL